MYKKNSWVLSIIVIGLCMIAAVQVSAQLKFGYIDIQRILAMDEESIAAQEKLEAERQAAIEELQRMENEFNESYEALNQQSLLLSEEKRQERQQELNNMYVEMQQYQQDKDQELVDRQTELMQPIYDKINAAIRKIRDSGGYDFIFDTMYLLDAKESYDLTDELLEEL
ncbi:OmpH family outer membrane protein [bacterium]|nr:OmpH family outer membrane protein [bacterium]RQV99149.1 MAG: OmpH family outer membrane protein [bacterium]